MKLPDSVDLVWRRLERWNRSPIAWGVLFSVGVLLVAALAAGGTACDDAGCGQRLDAILRAPFNEIGDTLSGFGSVLAFFWLTITVWLQRQELAEQRRELIAQRKETARMADAQAEQVRILQKQAEIFALEQEQRLEMAAKALLDQRLRGLVERIRDQQDRIVVPRNRSEAPANGATVDLGPLQRLSIGSESPDQVISTFRRAFSKYDGYLFRNDLRLAETDKHAFYMMEFLLDDIEKEIAGILDLLPRLSDDQRCRVSGLQFSNIRQTIRMLRENWQRS